MKYITLFLLAFPLIIIANPLFDIDDEKAKIYIEKYKHIAVAEMNRTGIPASIKMAQAILESGVGGSKLAINANNHFGIKCGGEVWLGDTYYMWDDETVKSCFRVYSSAEESFMAHSEFLMNPKKDYRYGFLFKLAPKDYKAWAVGLQSSGYATSKTYTKNLIAIIERLDLHRLDYLTSETVALSEGELAKVFPSLAPKPAIEDNDTTTVLVRVPDPFSGMEDSVSVLLTMNEFEINGLRAVYVQPDDNLDKIAMRYRKKTKQLYRYNELKGRKLKTGQYVFLEKKNNYYEASVPQKNSGIHIVRKGESMYDIAQQYGIKLKKIYNLNKAYKKRSPASGIKVFLRKLPQKKAAK